MRSADDFQVNVHRGVRTSRDSYCPVQTRPFEVNRSDAGLVTINHTAQSRVARFAPSVNRANVVCCCDAAVPLEASVIDTPGATGHFKRLSSPVTRASV